MTNIRSNHTSQVGRRGGGRGAARPADKPLACQGHQASVTGTRVQSSSERDAMKIQKIAKNNNRIRPKVEVLYVRTPTRRHSILERNCCTSFGTEVGTLVDTLIHKGNYTREGACAFHMLAPPWLHVAHARNGRSTCHGANLFRFTMQHSTTRNNNAPDVELNCIFLSRIAHHGDFAQHDRERLRRALLELERVGDLLGAVVHLGQDLFDSFNHLLGFRCRLFLSILHRLPGVPG